MKTSLNAIITILLALCGPAAAAGLDFIKGGDIAAMTAEIVVPAPSKALTPLPATVPLPVQPLRNWTVMIYMNGKNDQTFPMRDDINEMERVGSSAEMNVVAELGHIGTSDGGWPVSRVFVQKDDNPYWISSTALERRDGADMGDWRELADFMKWAKARFPARKYMLIVSGHGSGWWAQGIPSPLEKGISFDDQSKRHISTQGLRLALERGGGADVYASDACLMQMAEVAYEIRREAKFIVGSEDSDFSYDYGILLRKFSAAGADPAPAQLARATVEAYAEAYPAGYRGHDATHSYVDASKLDGLVPLVDAWVAEALRNKDKKAVKRAISEVKRFDASDYMDLPDFMRLAGAYARTPELREASERLRAYLTGEVIGCNAASGPTGASAGGLSLWIPYAYLKSYDALAFARDSRWDEFAASLVKHAYPN